MTPEQARKLEEVYQWVQDRKVIQLTTPVDDISKANIGALVYVSPGSTTKTQSVAVSSTPTNINVPAAYAKTVVVSLNGVQYELPSLI